MHGPAPRRPCFCTRGSQERNRSCRASLKATSILSCGIWTRPELTALPAPFRKWASKQRMANRLAASTASSSTRLPGGFVSMSLHFVAGSADHDDICYRPTSRHTLSHSARLCGFKSVRRPCKPVRNFETTPYPRSRTMICSVQCSLALPSSFLRTNPDSRLDCFAREFSNAHSRLDH